METGNNAKSWKADFYRKITVKVVTLINSGQVLEIKQSRAQSSYDIIFIIITINYYYFIILLLLLLLLLFLFLLY